MTQNSYAHKLRLLLSTFLLLWSLLNLIMYTRWLWTPSVELFLFQFLMQGHTASTIYCSPARSCTIRPHYLYFKLLSLPPSQLAFYGGRRGARSVESKMALASVRDSLLYSRFCCCLYNFDCGGVVCAKQNFCCQYPLSDSNHGGEWNTDIGYGKTIIASLCIRSRALSSCSTAKPLAILYQQLNQPYPLVSRLGRTTPHRICC